MNLIKIVFIDCELSMSIQKYLIVSFHFSGFHSFLTEMGSSHYCSEVNQGVHFCKINHCILVPQLMQVTYLLLGSWAGHLYASAEINEDPSLQLNKTKHNNTKQKKLNKQASKQAKKSSYTGFEISRLNQFIFTINATFEGKYTFRITIRNAPSLVKRFYRLIY